MTSNQKSLFASFSGLLLAGTLVMLWGCKEKSAESSAVVPQAESIVQSNAAPALPEAPAAVSSSRPPANLMKGIQPPPAALPQ
ncbi:MAG: hypothetical protein ACTHLW_08885 [Verrucomicrobiota bacterium]